MATREKIKDKIGTEDDFIYCPRLSNSVEQFMKNNPEGADNKKIAKVLLMEEEEVEEIFQSAIRKIRERLNITPN